METRLVRPERSSVFNLRSWRWVSMLTQISNSKVILDENDVNIEIYHYSEWPKEDRKGISVELFKPLKAVRISCLIELIGRMGYQSANLLDALLIIQRYSPERICTKLVLPDREWSSLNFEILEIHRVKRYILFEQHQRDRRWHLITPAGDGVVTTQTGILCVKK